MPHASVQRKQPAKVYSEKVHPQRMCCLTRAHHPQADLWRFVAGPDQTVYFDVTGKAPGRGAYLVPQAASLQHVIDLAAKKKGSPLSRALGAQVTSALFAQVQGQLRASGLSTLGFMKRANQLVLGAEPCKAHKARLAGLLVATDAGETTQALAAQFPECLAVFTKAELAQALGVPNCSIVGVLSGLTNWQLWPKLRALHTFSE